MGQLDDVALARIAREQDAAASKYLRDRDIMALEATMTRLDAEERDARQERIVTGVPREQAVRYLSDLRMTWEAADGGPGRKALAQALFRQDRRWWVPGGTLRLMDGAISHGFDAVLLERFGSSANGRGERASLSLTQQPLRFLMINRTPLEVPNERLATARRLA